MAYGIRGSGLITLGAAVLITVLCALVLTERSRPAYAQQRQTASSALLAGITPSELLRVCLGSQTRADWRPLLQFSTSDENVGALTREVLVRGRFECRDITHAELALAGFEVEPTGRLQLELRIENVNRDAYGSVEIIDASTGETKAHQALMHEQADAIEFL